MPVRVTPEEFASKHARRLKGAIEDVRAGVERVSEAPTLKAAQKETKMLQKLQEAVSSGKWSSRLKSVSLEEWKQKTLSKGLNRIASGVDEAYQKQVQFAQQLLSYQNELLNKVERMPDLTLEDSINRMTAWVRGMAQFKRK